jgi:hypothetical protein
MSAPTPVTGPTWTPPSSSASPGEGRSSDPPVTASPGEGRPSGGPTPGTTSSSTPAHVPPLGTGPLGDVSGLSIALLAAVLLIALTTLVFLIRRQRRLRTRPVADAPSEAGPVAPQVPSAIRSVAPPLGDVAAVDRAVRDFDIAATDAERAAAARVLSWMGMTVLAVRPGEPVNPRTHNVVGVSAGGTGAAGAVAEVVRPGWVRGGEVMRPADVVVYPAGGR